MDEGPELLVGAPASVILGRLPRSCLVGLLVAVASAASAADEAEYAVRWSAAGAAPRSASAVFSLLAKTSGAPQTFHVRYFDVARPADAPAGFTAILRERIASTNEPEVTWKYRGGASPAPGKKKDWRCPLASESKRKDESDISFLPDGKVKKVYSRSCTADATFAAAVPATLGAQPKGCKSAMVRYESTSGGLTVEEWRQEGGTLVIEVSMKDKDGKQARKAFKSKVVDVLVASGVKPLDRSKTEIGSQCGA